MENQTITLNVPSRKSNQVDFKGYKMYTEGDTANPNGLWLGNISFTPETEEAGLELLTQLKNLGVLKNFISQEEQVERIAPSKSSIAEAFAKLSSKQTTRRLQEIVVFNLFKLR